MGKRGPKKKTEAERKAAKSRGEPSQRRGNKILTLDKLSKSPPSSLTLEEKAVWRVFIKETGCIREIRTPDISQVIRYCRLSVRLDRVNKMLDDEGEVLTKSTTSGETKYKHPAWEIAIKIHDALKSMEESFGMTPMSRRKAGIETTDIKYVDDEPAGPAEADSGVDQYGLTESDYMDMMGPGGE